ncbi:MAG: hypothetical protein M1833_000952 [Piccolia ochrophora]|nr:MAG: hypothetical protein M1833_000952 [Piccolia ochrophora]
MAGADLLNNALEAATSFLEPIISRRQIEKARPRSLLDSLIGNVSSSSAEGTPHRTLIIERALALLSDIHYSVASGDHISATEDSARSPIKLPDLLYESSSQRVIYALLDLISLEGIYPFLSPGVGIPVERRVKSLLNSTASAMRSESTVTLPDQDGSVLNKAVDLLTTILQDTGRGIQFAVLDRSLVDILAACSELAFGPKENRASSNGKYEELCHALLKRYVCNPNGSTEIIIESAPLSALFPALTSLNHPAAPTWLRHQLTTTLSTLPLRPQGVRQVIDFISSSSTYSEPSSGAPATSGQKGIANASQAPLLSIEALSHASRLLSSVPSSMPAEVYFQRLAPQLFELLDGLHGEELSKAAGMVIGNVLSRKVYGAPGQAGWNAFAAPILCEIDPHIDEAGKNDLDEIIVTEAALDIALRRLATLVSSHPNPGLTKRLLGPSMLPLWSILCLLGEEDQEDMRSRASSLLRTYFKVSASTHQVSVLVDNLLFDGRQQQKSNAGWVHVQTRSKAVEVKKRGTDDAVPVNLTARLELASNRVEQFLRLLESGAVEEQGIASLFLLITRKWLNYTHSADEDQEVYLAGNGSNGMNPFARLINVKLIQGMLERVKSKLMNSPSQVLQLIREILDDFVKQLGQEEDLLVGSDTPTYATLAKIAASKTHLHEMPSSQVESSAEDTTATVTMALSLLSAVLSSSSPAAIDAEESILSTIQSPLKVLSASRSVPNPVHTTASNLSSLIDLLLSTSSSSHSEISAPRYSLLEDRNTHSLALSYLSDAAPPVRAHGLSLLTRLITSSSPLIDVQATSSLLVTLLHDSDEYTYLATISSLSALGTNHPRTILRLLVQRYVDRDEELSLDQRLRLGEALLRIVQNLGTSLTGEAAAVLGEGCLAIAGRRGQKPKAEEQRAKNERLKAAKQREVDSAWGGSVPELDIDGATDAESEQSAFLTRIIEGWSTNASAEDLRVRTSALSVLGLVVETSTADLGASLISTAIDLSMSILTLETRDEEAILRRAALLLVLSLLKGLERARSEDKSLGFGLWGKGVEDVSAVVGYVAGTDGDGLVREHAAKVGEELASWQRQGGLLGELAMGEQEIRTDLGGRLRGLAVDPESRRGNRPRIEEVE